MRYLSKKKKNIITFRRNQVIYRYTRLRAFVINIRVTPKCRSRKALLFLQSLLSWNVVSFTIQWLVYAGIVKRFKTFFHFENVVIVSRFYWISRVWHFTKNSDEYQIDRLTLEKHWWQLESSIWGQIVVEEFLVFSSPPTVASSFARG